MQNSQDIFANEPLNITFKERILYLKKNKIYNLKMIYNTLTGKNDMIVFLYSILSPLGTAGDIFLIKLAYEYIR